MKDQRNAKIRVCASCERIFIFYKMCPHCGFAHYGAIWAVRLKVTIIGLLIHWITKPNKKEWVEYAKGC